MANNSNFIKNVINWLKIKKVEIFGESELELAEGEIYELIQEVDWFKKRLELNEETGFDIIHDKDKEIAELKSDNKRLMKTLNREINK